MANASVDIFETGAWRDDGVRIKAGLGADLAPFGQCGEPSLQASACTGRNVSIPT